MLHFGCALVSLEATSLVGLDDQVEHLLRVVCTRRDTAQVARYQLLRRCVRVAAEHIATATAYSFALENSKRSGQ